MEGSAALYKARGEFNTDKIKQDIVNGALAEYAVYEYLNSIGIKSTAPDLTIYENKRKSFNPDLKSNGMTFHVKSQTKESADKYGLSWLFQEQDKILTLPGENSYLILCMIDQDKVHIKAVVSEIDLSEANIASKPKVGRYAHTKKAIYYDDLIKSKINLWRLP